MIEEPTVFILGAGASTPYGYPTGVELRQFFCKELGRKYFSFLRGQPRYENRIPREYEECSQFINQFCPSSEQLIDRFLSRNPDFEDTGKLLIIFSILYHEHKSRFREELEKENSKHDWYTYLFRILTEDLLGPDQYEISTNDISFITFNYDRSLEYILYSSLCNSFGQVPEDKIHNELLDLGIIHIYGKIAPLDWEDHTNGLAYKGPYTFEDLKKYSQNIKVMHHEYAWDRISRIKKAKNRIRNAKRIFFLGFGYDNGNMDILGFPDICQECQEIYGTALNFAPPKITKIKSKYFNTPLGGDGKVEIDDKDSLQLLSDYL